MKFGIALVGPNPYKDSLDDPDWVVQAMHHNLAGEAAKQILMAMDGEVARINAGRPKNEMAYVIRFTHALDHPEPDVTLCTACQAALDERYTMLAEERGRVKTPAVLDQKAPASST